MGEWKGLKVIMLYETSQTQKDEYRREGGTEGDREGGREGGRGSMCVHFSNYKRKHSNYIDIIILQTLCEQLEVATSSTLSSTGPNIYLTQ